MRRKQLFSVVAALVLATAAAPQIMAQNVAEIDISIKSTLPIKEASATTDGTYNYKNFEVEASSSGSYFAEFWLMPAKYAGGSYTTFKVYVNGEFVGDITPTVGNWQSARVAGHESVNLSKGKNVITIATLMPEFPEVETIKVAKSDADAVISDKAYKEYLKNAAEGIAMEVPVSDRNVKTVKAANGAKMRFFNDIPLQYTFYTTFTFKKDERVFITSTSSDEHVIDIVQYGENVEFELNPHPEYVISKRITGNQKPLVLFPATSEEMQKNSWSFHSTKSKNNANVQIVKVDEAIPVAGRYLIRVRHAVDKCVAQADVTINGEFIYQDVPICLYKADCKIPADGNFYSTMTSSSKSDDPILFIHGVDDQKHEKVVGLNDDGSPERRTEYDLFPNDAFISQKYNYETLSISVNNYSSSNPNSSCDIIARVCEGPEKSVGKSNVENKAVVRGTKQKQESAMQSDGIIADKMFVDLGLPSGTLWAAYNLGTESPYDRGPRYAWGEVETKEEFSWENYQFYLDMFYDENEGEWAILENIGNNICGTEYDAATSDWGHGWRMPNVKDVEELMYHTRAEYTVEKGIPGLRLYSRKNSHSIFLTSSVWIGELDENQCGFGGKPIEPSTYAELMYFVNHNNVLYKWNGSRETGTSIRPVYSPKESGHDEVIYYSKTGIDKIQEVGAEEAPLYDLYGHRVSNPQHGSIYIRAGKKVVY